MAIHNKNKPRITVTEAPARVGGGLRMGIWAKNVHCPPATLSRSWFAYRWIELKLRRRSFPRILTGLSVS